MCEKYDLLKNPVEETHTTLRSHSHRLYWDTFRYVSLESKRWCVSAKEI